MKLKPYPKCKDSGVQWIGKIPEGWEVKRLRFNALVNPSGKKALSNPKTLVNFLPMEKVSENGEYEQESEAEYQDVSTGYTYFEDNDVLVAKITPCFENGKGALVNNLKFGFGFGTTEFHVIRSYSQLMPKYLFYLTKTHLFRVTGEAFMEGAAGQKRVSTDFIKDFMMATPPLPDQTNIASFLDKRTARIDVLIEKDKKLIALLKEKRTALINHAVTKGLDSDAKMKDSGVDWIGEIPEGWRVRKLKQVTSIRISNVDKKSKPDEEEVLLCNYNEVYNNEFITLDLSFMKATASIEQINKFSIKKEDVIITKDSETPEDIAVPSLAEENLNNIVCGYHLALIRPNGSKIKGNFLLRLFQSKKINDQFVIYANGVTRFGISTHPIKNSFVIIPPLSEQTAIANFLDQATSKIDITIQKINEKITFLEEYKKSLIHHVVTGKVDVRKSDV